MPASCAGWLAVLRPRLAGGQLSGGVWRRLLDAAARYPAACLSILELRLGAGPAPVDLSVRVRPGECGAQIPSQQEIRDAFAVRLRDAAAVPACWLEHDLDRAGGADVPGLLCAELALGADADTVAEGVLPALSGAPLDAGVRRHVRRAMELLPQGGRAQYGFAPVGRGRGTVRLEVAGLGVQGMVHFAERLGGGRAAGSVERMAVLFPVSDRFHLSFDLGAAGIGERLGLEGSWARPPEQEGRWEELLSGLERRGLCSAAATRLLLRWPGQDTVWTAAGAWPREALGSGGALVRGLSHVKVVSRGDRPLVAKGYLAFQFRRRATTEQRDEPAPSPPAGCRGPAHTDGD